MGVVSHWNTIISVDKYGLDREVASHYVDLPPSIYGRGRNNRPLIGRMI